MNGVGGGKHNSSRSPNTQVTINTWGNGTTYVFTTPGNYNIGSGSRGISGTPQGHGGQGKHTESGCYSSTAVSPFGRGGPTTPTTSNGGRGGSAPSTSYRNPATGPIISREGLAPAHGNDYSSTWSTERRPGFW